MDRTGQYRIMQCSVGYESIGNLGRGEKSWVQVDRRASNLDPSPMVNSGLQRMLLSLMVKLIRSGKGKEMEEKEKVIFLVMW